MMKNKTDPVKDFQKKIAGYIDRKADEKLDDIDQSKDHLENLKAIGFVDGIQWVLSIMDRVSSGVDE